MCFDCGLLRFWPGSSLAFWCWWLGALDFVWCSLDRWNISKSFESTLSLKSVAWIRWSTANRLIRRNRGKSNSTGITRWIDWSTWWAPHLLKTASLAASTRCLNLSPLSIWVWTTTSVWLECRLKWISLTLFWRITFKNAFSLSKVSSSAPVGISFRESKSTSKLYKTKKYLKYFSIQIDLCNESEICFYITLGMFFWLIL